MQVFQKKQIMAKLQRLKTKLRAAPVAAAAAASPASPTAAAKRKACRSLPIPRKAARVLAPAPAAEAAQAAFTHIEGRLTDGLEALRGAGPEAKAKRRDLRRQLEELRGGSSAHHDGPAAAPASKLEGDESWRSSACPALGEQPFFDSDIVAWRMYRQRVRGSDCDALMACPQPSAAGASRVTAAAAAAATTAAATSTVGSKAAQPQLETGGVAGGSGLRRGTGPGPGAKAKAERTKPLDQGTERSVQRVLLAPAAVPSTLR
jgi:hypothetical protein